MKGREKEELQELLRKLLQSVYSICNEGLAKKRFRPEKELYFRRKVHGFHYDDNGAHIESWKSEELLKHVWYEATKVVEEKTKKLGLYADISERIAPIYDMKWKSPDYYLPSLDYFLSRLINVIARKTLDGEITEKSSLEPYIASFLRYLNHKDEGYRLIAQLSGIVLQHQSIQLDANTLLRRPTLEDIEVEYPAESFFLAGAKIFELSTAIMELTGASSSSLETDIYHAIPILCLFRVGGIEDIKYTTYTESLFALGITSSERIRLAKSGSYLVRNEDVETLKAFWASMKKVSLPIPAYTGERKARNELWIAYERYSDSLEAGILEKRISSAVMGLEALYSTEIDELPYRLSMRVGKLLSLIAGDYEPREVRDKVKDAYKIRNKYVHGVILESADRRRLEEKCGDLTEFAKTIMDYLRASIVALLKSPSKTSLIQRIDDSFLDSEKGEEIKKLLFMPYEEEAT